MINAPKETIKTGEWILKGREKIPEDIKQAFLKYCISNTLDCTKDYILGEADAISPDSFDSSDDENELAYADDRLYEVFNGSSDDEEFLGFK